MLNFLRGQHHIVRNFLFANRLAGFAVKYHCLHAYLLFWDWLKSAVEELCWRADPIATIFSLIQDKLIAIANVRGRFALNRDVANHSVFPAALLMAI